MGLKLTINPTTGKLDLVQNLSAYLKTDQTTPQTTVGTFTFPAVVSPTLTGGTAVGSNIIYKSTTGIGTTTGIAHQWTGGTNGGNVIATMLNNGNVGIGTITPAVSLEVYSDTGVRFTRWSNQLAQYTYFLNNSSTNKIGFSAFNNKPTTIQNDAQLTDVVGNAMTLGAGSTVAGTSVSNVAGGQLILQSGLGTGTGASTISFQTGTTLTTGLALQTMSTKMTILGNGNVGIGTTTPTYKLDVRGTATADGIRSAMGFDIYKVPDPTAPTGAVSAGGSVDTGLHHYSVSYTTAIGETHTVYVVGGVTTTVGNNTVTLTIPVSTDQRVTGRKIYRTKVGDANYLDYLLATIANNTATTYVDTVADSTLTGGSGQGYYRTNSTSNNITVNGNRSMVLDTNNVALGPLAGNAIANFAYNTYIGSSAGLTSTGGSNTFIGWQAGVNNITKSHNAYIGFAVGGGMIGGFNTILGSLAGTGAVRDISNNIFIGFRAGNLETASNKLIIDSVQRLSEASGRSYALIYGITSATPANQILSLGGGGNVGIGTTAPGEKLEVTGNIQLTTDGNLLKMGTGEDMTIQYTGTDGRIDTSIVAPSDLIVDCGTDKTLVLEESVYVDIDFPIIIRTTGVGQPALTAFNGNLLMPEWEVDDFNMCESQEFIHGWKEGSSVSWHVHLTTNGTNVDNRYVKFELEYAYSVDGVWTFPAVFTTADLLIPANTPGKKQMIMPITAFTPTGSKIGDHILARLKRVSATGTAPTSDPWIPMLQVHVECDTIGSRQIGTK